MTSIDELLAKILELFTAHTYEIVTRHNHTYMIITGISIGGVGMRIVIV